MSKDIPERWRKCMKCIADGKPECLMALDKTESPERCKGPFNNFGQMKRRERRPRA